MRDLKVPYEMRTALEEILLMCYDLNGDGTAGSA